jgi:pyruvate kinase
MEEQEVRIEMVRTASKKLGIPISLLLDTKGPEIRIADMGKEGQTIEKGTNVTISALENKTGTSNSFSVTDSTGTYNMANDVKVKSKILVDDGKLFLEVTAVDVKKGIISAVALNSHLVKTNKRINLPGASYSMDFVSEKDKKDIILAAKYGFAYVAASFVNNASNVNEIRKILKDNGGADVQLISKIESTEGIENLDAIIQVSDGIMVARGDLGIEIPFETVPY